MDRVFITGTVTDNQDKEGLGRLKVKLHGFPNPVETPWLRQLVPHGSQNSGFIFLPEEGDEVVLLAPVSTDNGSVTHLSSMLVLGAVYNGKRKPEYVEGDHKQNNYKQIQTKSGNAVVFNDKSGSEAVLVQSKNKSTSVKLEGGKKQVTVEASGAKIVVDGAVKVSSSAGKGITISATGGNVKVSGTKIVLQGQGGVDLQAAGPVKIQGSMIDIQGGMINFAGMVNM